MRALRLIYRLDFKRNFEVMNKPGDAARLVEGNSPKELFAEFGEERSARRFLGRNIHDKGKAFQSLAIDPTAVVIDVERIDGIELQKLGSDLIFNQLLDVAQSVVEHFKITEVTRCGLRIYTFDSIADGKSEEVVKRFSKYISSDMERSVRSILGPTTDIGIQFDGKSDANVNYHCRLGPFTGKKEVKRYLSSTELEFPEETSFDVMMDLDMYETNFNYGSKNISKWWKPIVDSNIKVFQRIKNQLQGE